jgi:4-deoxy-L-threo-5-hexosulose-uronate ketol-isomerase
METRSLLSKEAFSRLNTSELRNQFLIESLFCPGELYMLYSEQDRAIAGSAVPLKDELSLKASKKEMGAEFFTERRELGIINIGRTGTVKVDGSDYRLGNKDGMYIGKGEHLISFSSQNENDPAMFYFVSYPAHKEYPMCVVPYDNAEKNHLGELKDCNVRTINKYIRPGGVESCQLVMGLTEIEEGSIWNTMPAHTHQRRSEIYMYFNIKEDAALFHLMGEPAETRHIVMKNGEAVINPSWSIHSGAGTRNYSFIWAMGGENQVFDDMDWVEMKDLK